MRTLDGPQSGARGEVVASRNHYGQHLRKKGHPKKRFTEARLQSDTSMRVVAEAWNQLTDEQRDRWYVTGPNVPSRKVLGKAGALDGRGFFFKVNIPRARLGQELLLAPPAQADFGQHPAVAFTITNDKWDFAMELTLARAPTEEIMLWASPPCSAGKRRNWDYRVLGLLPTPVEGANNFRRLYAKRFGVPPVGKRVFVRVQQQTNGWRGKPWEASAVVPPSEGQSGRRSDRQGRGTNRGV
ncbi:MAG: hypothetical protein NT154_17100 [Verrucomicrobia bacterium]|nr:hypothetical protein [Verrucomicrobiota bacterium]